MVAVQALEGRLGMIHKTFGVTREQDVSVIEGKCGSWTTSETGLSIEYGLNRIWGVFFICVFHSVAVGELSEVNSNVQFTAIIPCSLNSS